MEINEEVLAELVTSASDLVEAYDKGSGIWFRVEALREAVKKINALDT